MKMQISQAATLAWSIIDQFYDLERILWDLYDDEFSEILYEERLQREQRQIDPIEVDPF
jgi:hypothetical protein